MDFLNLINSIRDYMSNQSILNQYACSVLMLSFVILSSLWSILSYVISIYIIEQYKIEEKYPKLAIFFKPYKLFGTFDIITSSILCFICVSTLMITSMVMVYYS